MSKSLHLNYKLILSLLVVAILALGLLFLITPQTTNAQTTVLETSQQQQGTSSAQFNTGPFIDQNTGSQFYLFAVSETLTPAQTITFDTIQINALTADPAQAMDFSIWKFNSSASMVAAGQLIYPSPQEIRHKLTNLPLIQNPPYSPRPYQFDLTSTVTLNAGTTYIFVFEPRNVYGQSPSVLDVGATSSLMNDFPEGKLMICDGTTLDLSINGCVWENKDTSSFFSDLYLNLKSESLDPVAELAAADAIVIARTKANKMGMFWAGADWKLLGLFSGVMRWEGPDWVEYWERYWIENGADSGLMAQWGGNWKGEWLRGNLGAMSRGGLRDYWQTYWEDYWGPEEAWKDDYLKVIAIMVGPVKVDKDVVALPEAVIPVAPAVDFKDDYELNRRVINRMAKNMERVVGDLADLGAQTKNFGDIPPLTLTAGTRVTGDHSFLRNLLWVSFDWGTFGFSPPASGTALTKQEGDLLQTINMVFGFTDVNRWTPESWMYLNQTVTYFAKAFDTADDINPRYMFASFDYPRGTGEIWFAMNNKGGFVPLTGEFHDKYQQFLLAPIDTTNMKDAARIGGGDDKPTDDDDGDGLTKSGLSAQCQSTGQGLVNAYNAYTGGYINQSQLLYSINVDIDLSVCTVCSTEIINLEAVIAAGDENVVPGEAYDVLSCIFPSDFPLQ